MPAARERACCLLPLARRVREWPGTAMGGVCLAVAVASPSQSSSTLPRVLPEL